MTLLLIARKVWRYKFVTLPIIVLTYLGAGYVIAIKKPVYSTSASYILVNPPSPPTPEEIARNPKIGEGSNNPYTRFSDQSIVGQILTARLGSRQVRENLAALGADTRYTVEPDVSFGFSTPIVKITGMGSSSDEAVASANIVGREFTRLLAEMQEARGVAPKYRITSQLLVGARQATPKASGKVRGLVAVLALGGILLFLAVSVMDAITILRRREVDLDAEVDPTEHESTPHPASDDLDRAEGSVMRQAPDGPSNRELWHVPS